MPEKTAPTPIVGHTLLENLIIVVNKTKCNIMMIKLPVQKHENKP